MIDTKIFPTWCPGCGNFGIWAALKASITKLGLNLDQYCLVFDIGCSGNSSNFYNTFGFHSLHGRAIPSASGIKLANHTQKVIVVGGDGGLLSEGLTHFVSAARANMDITVIIHNNQVYGLTTGQSSPTSSKGSIGRATPLGVVEQPLDPVSLSIISGASFVARSYSGNIPETTKIITAAIQHKGFSVVEVLQPCVTFNKVNSHAFFQQRVKPLTAKPLDDLEALGKAIWSDTEINLGVFKQIESVPYHQTVPILKDKTLIQHHQKRDLSKYLS